MNKNIIAAIIVILIGAGLGIYIATNSSDESENNGESTQNSENTQDQNQNANDSDQEDNQTQNENQTRDTESENELGSDNEAQGLYTEYNENLLANANEGEVVLFFKADWCPTCNRLEDAIQSNLSQIPQDLSILYLDYDEEDELKRKYNVGVQHTLVQVDSEGNEIKKWIGSTTLDSLVQEVV